MNPQQDGLLKKMSAHCPFLSALLNDEDKSSSTRAATPAPAPAPAPPTAHTSMPDLLSLETIPIEPMAIDGDVAMEPLSISDARECMMALRCTCECRCGARQMHGGQWGAHPLVLAGTAFFLHTHKKAATTQPDAEKKRCDGAAIEISVVSGDKAEKGVAVQMQA